MGKRLKGETGVASNRDSNLTIEPVKEPPSRRREAGEAEKILAAYPPDRLRGKAACFAQIEEAVKEGVRPEDLLQAVQAYATDSTGSTRSKVCFLTTGFSHGAGSPLSRSKRNTGRNLRHCRPITMRGWPAGSVIRAGCASTLRPRKSGHCLPQSW